MRALIRTALLACCFLPNALAGQGSIEVRLEHDTEAERAAREQLLRVVREYDVAPWLFTRTIRIDETEIPHSHPVLTLHTRHLGDDLALLATFIHEQFHWFVAERDAQADSAISSFRTHWPDVPVGNGEGARDEYSTYLHLIVCDLELQGMERLVGRERAAQVLAGTTHYRWIYERVLSDPEVRATNTRWGFIVP